MRVLLVEDDGVLGEGISKGLTLEGFRVDWLTDGADADVALASDEFAVVVLDLGLPGVSGQDLLGRWRRAGHDVPILVLTAHDTRQNCLDTLNGGADDYVVKPVELDELVARLKALKRRSTGRSDNRLVAGSLILDLTARTGTLNHTTLDLSSYEFVVLEALAERGDRPVSRHTLEERLYGWNGGPESNALEVLIHKLRGKIGRDRIKTIRGTGYRLVT